MCLSQQYDWETLQEAFLDLIHTKSEISQKDLFFCGALVFLILENENKNPTSELINYLETRV